MNVIENIPWKYKETIDVIDRVVVYYGLCWLGLAKAEEYWQNWDQRSDHTTSNKAID